MNDIHQLDRTYHYILKTFVARGKAPTYAEIGEEFQVGPETGKKFLHDLIHSGTGVMWLEQGSDSIASFAPFNNAPTPYRITVEGEQKWFAQ